MNSINKLFLLQTLKNQDMSVLKKCFVGVGGRRLDTASYSIGFCYTNKKKEHGISTPLEHIYVLFSLRFYHHHHLRSRRYLAMFL